MTWKIEAAGRHLETARTAWLNIETSLAGLHYALHQRDFVSAEMRRMEILAHTESYCDGLIAANRIVSEEVSRG